jgi:tetratricopeptide (TPR) repeat protein
MGSWSTLGRLYQPGKPLRALEIYEKILNRDGDQPDILYRCGVLYTSLGRFDQAAEKFKHMLNLDPGNKQYQKQLADAYTKAGRLSEAKKILESIGVIPKSSRRWQTFIWIKRSTRKRSNCIRNFLHREQRIRK